MVCGWWHERLISVLQTPSPSPPFSFVRCVYHVSLLFNHNFTISWRFRNSVSPSKRGRIV
ncbi:unnamed protein product [Ixodes persulcatus]